ncbi:MAG: AAA family ATPase [Proteobacteria bacterium]|nr:AAA family ATPase [Pseudomonadota bacterium]
MPPKHREVPVSKLRQTVDPDSLGFATTAEFSEKRKGVVAQERAVAALDFGLGIDSPEFNIYVAGTARTGMGYLARNAVQTVADKLPTPNDWCYVYNFRSPDEPRTLRLPPGLGNELKRDMTELMAAVGSEVPEIFESEDYTARKEELVREFHQQRAEILQGLEGRVESEGFMLNISQMGMVIVPAREGKPLEEAELKAMTEERRQLLRDKSNHLQGEMNAAVQRIRAYEKEMKAKLKELDTRVALFAVGYLIDDLQKKYGDLQEVMTYLKEVKNDIINNIEGFKEKKDQPPPGFPFAPPASDQTDNRYEVNVLVDNSETKGAPVVVETNPTYPNLFGGFERKSQFGALFTDFTLIRPGALHQANGGFLIMKAMDLLKWYFSWEALKRALRNQDIRIEDAVEQLGLMATKTLKPEPIPLDIRIVLIGEHWIYQILHAYDDHFQKLFKVKAHMDHEMDRTKKNVSTYAEFIAASCRRNGLRPLDKRAVARVIEHASELAGGSDKLTLQLGDLLDTIKEADYWAKKKKHKVVGLADVEKAVDQKIFRSNLVEEKLQEYIEKDIIIIETEGQVVGQINGLSVYMLGDYTFGRPSRITATVSLGRAGIVDINREAKLSGSIHTKGVLILSGFMASRFAANHPLTLSAGLTFEQSYGIVDGDSASGAELFVLLSALAEAPIKQGIACTGAVSQRGEILPIGGVTQKVEGFFAVCRAKGLTGDQGVIIPGANVRDLMLKKEVVEAVAKGKFHVWPIKNVDQGLEILTGIRAGRKRKDGTFTPGSINARVAAKLKDMAEKAKKSAAEEGPKRVENELPTCDSCGQ